LEELKIFIEEGAQWGQAPLRPMLRASNMPSPPLWRELDE